MENMAASLKQAGNRIGVRVEAVSAGSVEGMLVAVFSPCKAFRGFFRVLSQFPDKRLSASAGRIFGSAAAAEFL